MLIESIVSRIQKLGNGATTALRQTAFGSLAVAQVEPAGAEASRAGRRFLLGNNAGITGIAPVTVMPTTAAQWAIWNLDPLKSLEFEQLGMYLTAGTPGVGGVLLACLFTTPAQTAGSQTGCAITSASNGALASKAICKQSVSITTPAAPNWFPVASNFGSNVTAFASSTYLENRSLDGRLIVPPGQGLGLAVVSPAGTTPLFAPFAMWVEDDADLV